MRVDAMKAARAFAIALLHVFLLHFFRGKVSGWLGDGDGIALRRAWVDPDLEVVLACGNIRQRVVALAVRERGGAATVLIGESDLYIRGWIPFRVDELALNRGGVRLAEGESKKETADKCAANEGSAGRGPGRNPCHCFCSGAGVRAAV